jgi:DNA polymerase delta subunit 3
MLFEFHRQQNVKKPGTVHATYLVAGTRRKSLATTNNGNTVKGGEDEYMQSSPFRSSPIPPNHEEVVEDHPIFCITLVREEDLEGMHSIFCSNSDKI